MNLPPQQPAEFSRPRFSSGEGAAFRPQVIAHRGVQVERLSDKLKADGRDTYRAYPENTLPAFVRAAELDVDGIELDVIAVRDGKKGSRLIVHHDNEWGRTFTGPGNHKKVMKTPFNQVRQATYRPESLRESLEKKSGKAPDATTHWEDTPPPVIPGLEEVIDEVRKIKPGMHFYLEMKTPSSKWPVRTQGLEKSLARYIREQSLYDQVTVIGFNPWTVARIKRIDPKIQTGLDLPPPLPGWLSEKNQARLMRFIRRWIKADVVLPTYRQVSPSTLRAAQAAQLKVIPWVRDETVKEEQQAFSQLTSSRVAGIISNTPGELQEWLAQSPAN